MRKGMTALMLLVLFAALANCQLFGCTPQISDTCCHKHAGPKTPCLHGLLEQGKAGAVLAHAIAPVPAVRVVTPPVSVPSVAIATDISLPGLADLYLRNRVLLI
jgi:hypothetical protein